MTNRERKMTFRSLICVAGGLLALSVAAIAFAVWSLRADVADDAVRDIRNVATLLAEQTARSVQSVEIVLDDLHDRIRDMGGSTPDSLRRLTGTKDMFSLLQDRLARLPQASALGIVDDSGHLWATTRNWPALNLSVADQEYFSAQKASRDAGLFLSIPVRDRTTGVTTIHLSRSITGPNGEFLGVLVAGMEVGYFNRVYSELRWRNDHSILLMRDDGTILFRYPYIDEIVGNKLPVTSQWYAAVAKGGGHFESSHTLDEMPRFIAVQPVKGYPLVVNATVTHAAAFANWRRRALFIGAGTLVIFVCSALLLRALNSHFRKLLASETSLAEREGQLAQQTGEIATAHMQVDAALNNITQGLCMFDKNGRIVVVNKRYIDMYGMSPDVIKPGCSLRDLIMHRIAVGMFKGDPEQYLEDITAAVREGRAATFIVETTDGRTVYAVQQPMANGGWVVTHDDITERRRAEDHMSHMARHDTLTGLANRMQLLEKMQDAVARLRRKGEAFSIFVFDLDLFKAVNDSLGHPVGDALLKAVAQRIRACTRDVDTVARLGGDEFALLQVADKDQREGAIILANRLLETIGAPYEIDGHQIVIGTSIGIVLAPVDGTDPDQLLKNADLALYRAKAEGRNGFRLFEPKMDAEARARHALQTDLRAAIAQEQFELHYQTIYEAGSQKPCGAEALVRWRHPQRGLISPMYFIPLAEEIGVIGPLGEWVLRKACSDAARWPSHIKVAVNLSATQFRNANLMDAVTGALIDSSLPAERLEIEITESVLLQKNATNLSVLHQLKDLGISVVLDDFGTGYSSLSYLRMFPFDKIKIDRSFVGELSNRADCAAIVCAVTGLGRGLRILTTAEGVETAEQLELLRAAGVDQVQGFLLSRPCPVSQLEFLNGVAGEKAA